MPWPEDEKKEKEEKGWKAMDFFFGRGPLRKAEEQVTGPKPGGQWTQPTPEGMSAMKSAAEKAAKDALKTEPMTVAPIKPVTKPMIKPVIKAGKKKKAIPKEAYEALRN